MSTLFIMPHMDDEVISCGGLIHTLTFRSKPVKVATVYGRVYDYGDTDGFTEEQQDFNMARSILKYTSFINWNFKEGEPQETGFYKILRKVEETLKLFNPHVVVGPSRNDLNQDHRMLSHILDIALRPINRGRVHTHLECIALDGTTQTPNYYVPIDEVDLAAKQKAMVAYRREYRESPSPRCSENIRAQALVWGAAAGYPLAEAYVSRFIIGF